MSRNAWWLTFIAFAARAALMAFESGLTYDGTYYLRQAARLATGDFQWVGFPPGYPAAIWGLGSIVGDPELAARIVSLIAGTATVGVFHAWARRAVGTRAAVVASLVLALHPDLVRAGSAVLSESLYVLFVVAGVVWCERRAWAASLALGIAFLCRPEALLVLVGLPAVLALGNRRAPGAAWLLGLGVVALYSSMTSRAVGHFVISPKQGQLDLGVDVLSRLWTMLHMTHAVFPLVLLPGAIWIGVRARRVWLVPCLYLLVLPLYDIHIQQRLLLPALPFLILMAAFWLQRVAPLTRRVTLGVALVLLGLGTFATLESFGSAGVVTSRAREIGAELAAHLGFDDRVAGRFPFVAYYAGAGFARLPLAAYPALMDSVIAMGATHLLVLESEMRDITPQLRPLFDDAIFTAAEGRLHATAWVDEPPGHRAILYRMRQPDISAKSAPVVQRAVQGATWLHDDLVVAGPHGLDLLPVPAGARAPDTTRVMHLTHGPALDPAASADGQRIAFVRVDDDRAEIAVFDLETQRLQGFESTADDAPVSPTFVGHSILYVRRAEPGGLRLLDPESGNRREVGLQGLASLEARPLAVTARDGNVAITYVRSEPRDALQRVIATATWPQPIPATGSIELPGDWATEQSLADDNLAWLPGQRRVLASIAIRLLDHDGNATDVIPSIAVVHSSAVYRRLSYDLDRVRRPVRRASRIAFIAGDGDLHVGWLDPGNAQIPRTRVYDSVLTAP